MLEIYLFSTTSPLLLLQAPVDFGTFSNPYTIRSRKKIITSSK